MDELFEKDWLDYEPPKFGSFKWLEAQSGYQKIGELIKEKPAIKTALKDMLCMSVQSAVANVDTSDRQLTIPVVMPRYFKERRQKLNMSMQNVTDKTDISKATISRIERGQDAFYKTIVALDKFYSDNGA